jgi:hypothetical protein
MAMGNIYLDIFVSQLPLYALIIGCAYVSWHAIKHRKSLHAVLPAAIAGLPFASYAYSVVDARYFAPSARQREVASWHRIGITRDNKPRTFLTTWGSGGSVARTLVDLGRFERAYGLIADDWYSFERPPGSTCTETQDSARPLRRQDDLRGSTACITATKIGSQHKLMPQIDEPHLRLLTDRAAPSHHESNRGVYASSTLELRLVSGENNQLVSFWEIPYFDVPVFPPILIIREGKGWVRESFEGSHPPSPEPIKFVLDAIDGVSM